MRLIALAVLATRGGERASGDWPVHGRTPGEQRYSPLDQIDEHNVGAARARLDATRPAPTRGLEATPIVADGVLYATGSWSVVFALDARTGRELWRFDPHVSGEVGARACCDVVNRGVAVYGGRVYLGALDGRLIALDAETGAPLWEVQTTDPALPYTITGAPRVVKGKVVIGNGGADIGVRGYVSAYDAETGALAWRFYTVPGDPAQPPESPALARRAADLAGRRVVEGRRRRHGLGLARLRPRARPALRRHRQRRAVDAAPAQPRRQSVSVVDPRAAPRHRRARLALPDDAGRSVGLHRDAAHDPRRARDRRPRAARADAGAEERLLLRARPRDRRAALGRAVRAGHAGRERVDLASGRPVEAAGARYGSREAAVLSPGPVGGHNWQPMSFHPGTGLVYIPALEMPFAFRDDAGLRAAAESDERRRRPARGRDVDGRRGAIVARADRVGSGAAARGVARRAPARRERRHARHRGQSRVPGHRARHARRLSRQRREAPVRGAHGHRRGGAADHLSRGRRAVRRRARGIRRRARARERRSAARHARDRQRRPRARVEARRDGGAARSAGLAARARSRRSTGPSTRRASRAASGPSSATAPRATVRPRSAAARCPICAARRPRSTTVWPSILLVRQPARARHAPVRVHGRRGRGRPARLPAVAPARSSPRNH